MMRCSARYKMHNGVKVWADQHEGERCSGTLTALAGYDSDQTCFYLSCSQCAAPSGVTADGRRIAHEFETQWIIDAINQRLAREEEN